MQDNRLNIDKNFENKAWSNMEALLDEHMPVKRKKRVLWWWILSFLIIITIGVSIFFNSSSMSDDQIKSEHTYEADVVENDMESITPSEQDKHEDYLTSSQKDFNSNSDKTITSSNAPSSKMNIYEPKVSHDVRSQNVGQKLFSNSSENIVISRERYAEDDTDKMSKSKPVESEKNDLPEIELIDSRLMNLPSRWIQLSEFSNPLDLVTSIVKPIQNSPRNLQTSMLGYVSAHTGNFKSYGGWESGLILSQNIYGRIGMDLNLSYSNLKKHGFNEFIGISTYDPIYDIQNSIESTYANEQPLLDELLYSVDHVEYLNIGTNLRFGLTKRIHLLAGADMSYLITLKTETYERPVDEQSSILALPLRLEASENFNNEYPLNRWDLSYNFGIGYDYKRFHAFIKYNRGARTIIDLTQEIGLQERGSRRDMNRSFEVGFGYRLF